MLLADRLSNPGRTLGPKYLTPLDFDDNLMGWWDASTLGLADSADVTTWPDLSGNGLDFTAQTADEPVFAAGAHNGRGAVRFDDDQDRYMDTASFSAVAQPGTILLVCTSSSAAGYMIVDGQTTSRWTAGSTGSTNADFGCFAGSGTTGIAGATWARGIRAVWVNTTNGIVWDITNGSLAVGDVGSNSITGFRLGRHQSTTTRRYDGDLCELAIWARAVPPDELGALARDLAAKWGI